MKLFLKNEKQFLSLTDLHTHMKLAPQWYSTYQKAKTSHFGSNTLRYDGVNLWNKFYYALLYK